MIVDSSLLTNLALGTDRRIIEAGDVQLQVPPTLLPVVDFLQPTLINVTPTGLQNTSFTESVAFVHTNQAAAISTIALLAKGLWRIQMQLMAWFDYTGGPGGGDEVTVRFRNTPTAILSEIMSFYAQIGMFTSQGDYTVLMPDDWDINFRRPTNTVGQTIITRLSVNAIRIL